MAIGATLMDLRRSRGLSLDQVAAAVNVAGLADDGGKRITLSGAGLSRIETGTRLPSAKTMQGLAAAYNIAFFIDRDGVVVMQNADAPVPPVTAPPPKLKLGVVRPRSVTPDPKGGKSSKRKTPKA